MDLIFKRRTIKPMQMTGEIIPKQDLEQILLAATMAPNHKLSQPWRFTILSGAAKTDFSNWAIQLHQKKYPNSTEFESQSTRLNLVAAKSSHLIAIHMKPKTGANLPEWEEIAAVSAAVQNLHLAAESLGYSGIWSTSFPTFETETRDLFGLQDEKELFMGFFFIGVPSQRPEQAPKRQPIDQVCVWKDSL